MTYTILRPALAPRRRPRSSAGRAPLAPLLATACAHRGRSATVFATGARGRAGTAALRGQEVPERRLQGRLAELVAELQRAGGHGVAALRDGQRAGAEP